MTLVREAAANGSLQYAYTGIVKKLSSAFNSPSQHVLVWRDSERLFEQFRKIMRSHSRCLSQRRQRNVLIQMLFNEFNHTIEACFGEAIPRLHIYNRLHTVTALEIDSKTG